MKEQKHLRCKLINILVSFLLLSIFLTALLGVATAQGNSITLELVGQIGGPTQAVAVQGNYAYVGVGLRLVVLDISDPTTPTVVGTTEPLPHFVEDVVVNGTVAYVAAGGAGMYMLNISDPANPAVIGTYDTPGYAEGIAVDGKYAYVADGPYGLRIVDISNPISPAEIAFAYPLNYAFDVAVDEQYVYLAAAGAGLLVVNISDPTHPTEVGTHDTQGYAYGIDVAENMVYIADGWEGLRVVNASDPAHPVEVGFYDTLGWAFGVDIVGSMAYVADAFGGLRVLDASDPTHPAELGGYEVSGGHTGSVVVADNMAYVADRNWGLRIVDVSNPVAPIQLGFYGPMSYADGVAVAGDYAYVAEGTYGLRVVDISDPTQPIQVGAYEAQGYATSVAVAGDYAYVAIAGGGAAALHVVDISNSTQPIRTGLFQGDMWTPRDMVFTDQIVYIADEWGLRLIDVSNPFAPTELGFIRLIEWPDGNVMSSAVGVAVNGTLAYVASEEAGLKIVDVSNPVSPTLVGVCCWPGFAQDVVVAQGFAYVADTDGLTVVDVSDPTQPTFLGSYNTIGFAESVAMAENHVYVADGGAGLSVIDVSTPSAPILAALYNTPGYAQEVAVNGDYTYIADQDGGLLILQKIPTGLPQRRLTTSVRKQLGRATPEHAAVSSEKLNPIHLLPSLHTAAPTRQRAIFPVEDATSASTSEFLISRSGPSAVRMAATCTVTSAADTGPGTLRWCLENAVSGDTITFDSSIFPPTSPMTIALESELPSLTRANITIDASNAGVILDGSGTPEGTVGLTITSDGNVVRGLQILHFPWSGIIIQGGQNNTVGGDRAVGTGPIGQGNFISGSQDANVLISGTGGDYNVITGNLIGADPIGTFALCLTPPAEEKPTGVGIYVQSGAQHNVIGPGNVINGNNFGVQLLGDGTEDNIIIGNLIGTDISGTVAIGNFWSGIALSGGAQKNRIGGKTADERNIVSGNEGNGIYIGDSRDNVVVGNFIGVDATGVRTLGNRGNGIQIDASHNRVGGKDARERNIISGNGVHGVSLVGNNTGNAIIGNYIGTDVSGTNSLGNGDHGVAIELGAYNNLVENNVIITTGRNAVLINDWGSSYNVVIGNLIGTDARGTIALGGGFCSVLIGMGAGFNRIGGTTPEERNIIVGGIFFGRQGAIGNLVIGNFIGTDISGTNGISRMGSGVALGDGSRRPFIGGTTEGERNVISGNPGGGIKFDPAVDYVFIGGNYIGTDASGTVAVGNQGDGIRIDSGERNIIQNNTIAYNSGAGVSVDFSTYNTIRRNSIHSHAGTGISISSSGNNTIYHNNLINNTIQAYDNGYNNSWDSGPVEGGNYWSDHVCEGNPSTGSQPYNISGGSNVDRYPFQDPNGWLIENQPPIASFTYSPENPMVNQTITFNASSSYDPDGNITKYKWELGDGNITNTTEEIITHSYYSAGDYTVNLTVTDDDDAANTTSTIVYVKPWILNLNVPFYQEEKKYYSVAASCKMILDYIRENTTLTQDELYDYGHAHNHPNNTGILDIDPQGVKAALNNYKPKEYHFDIIAKSNVTDLMRDICHWMDYEVPGVNMTNTPAAVPTFGGYDNWMVVRGASASADPDATVHPWEVKSFTVYGFWLNDPNVTGIGENFYATAEDCNDTYFKPLNTNDSWNGKYVAVLEPPETLSEAEVKIAGVRMTDSGKNLVRMIEAKNDAAKFYEEHKTVAALAEEIEEFAWENIIDPSLLRDESFMEAFNGTIAREPLKITRTDKSVNNYYLIPFGLYDKTSVVLLIDAAKGYFKEASWVDEPVEYLTMTEQEAINRVLEKIANEPAEITAKLVWEPGKISSSPYYPVWKVVAEFADFNEIWFVAQDGTVSSPQLAPDAEDIETPEKQG